MKSIPRRLMPSEFRDALEKGLGRAARHVSAFGTDGLEADIYRAAVEALAYDHQCEDSRADWLVLMIRAVPEQGNFRQRIFQGLSAARDFWSINQLMEVCQRFAAEGDSGARAALYAKFEAGPYENNWLGGEELLALDGMRGLLHVASVIGHYLLTHADAVADDYLLQLAFEQFGEETVREALAAASIEDDGIRAYCADTIDSPGSARGPTSSADRREIGSFEELKEGIEDGNVALFKLWRFGRLAVERDIERAFECLLAERDPLRLGHWFEVFSRRAMPDLHPRLFQIARASSDRLQFRALQALRNIKHPAIRELALQLLAGDPTQPVSNGAFELLKLNFADGDERVIERVIVRLRDRDAIHFAGLSLLNVAEAQPQAPLAACLLWMYEATPCSNCRYGAVKELLHRHAAPDWLLEEAKWDCVEDTRRLAMGEAS